MRSSLEYWKWARSLRRKAANPEVSPELGADLLQSTHNMDALAQMAKIRESAVRTKVEE